MADLFGANLWLSGPNPWLDVRSPTYGAKGDGVTDDTAAIQAALTAASGNGYAVWFAPGIYIITSALTFGDHVALMGPLRHRGEWWSSTGKGAVLRNTSASAHTLAGAGGTFATLNSAIIGLAFESSTTSGAHISLPATTNSVRIENCSFQGAANAILTTGLVYDLHIYNNFFQAQTGATINKQAHGGVSVHIEGNYFRAGNRQAILLGGGGTSGREVLWTIRKNVITGYRTAGIGAFDATTNGINLCDLSDNQFEGNNGANSWNVLAQGDAWSVFNNEFDNGVNGVEGNPLTNSVIGPNRFASLSGFAIQLDSGSTNVAVMPQGNPGAAAITDNGTRNSILTTQAFGTPTLTLLQGSGAADYSHSGDTAFANVDGANLSKAVTIPVGWKAAVTATAELYQTTAAAGYVLAIADGGTVINATGITPPAPLQSTCVTVECVITGDNASHTLSMQYKTFVAADAVNITNQTTANRVPTLKILLVPSA